MVARERALEAEAARLLARQVAPLFPCPPPSFALCPQHSNVVIKRALVSGGARGGGGAAARGGGGGDAARIRRRGRGAPGAAARTARRRRARRRGRGRGRRARPGRRRGRWGRRCVRVRARVVCRRARPSAAGAAGGGGGGAGGGGAGGAGRRGCRARRTPQQARRPALLLQPRPVLTGHASSPSPVLIGHTLSLPTGSRRAAVPPQGEIRAARGARRAPWAPSRRTRTRRGGLTTVKPQGRPRWPPRGRTAAPSTRRASRLLHWCEPAPSCRRAAARGAGAGWRAAHQRRVRLVRGEGRGVSD